MKKNLVSSLTGHRRISFMLYCEIIIFHQVESGKTGHTLCLWKAYLLSSLGNTTRSQICTFFLIIVYLSRIQKKNAEKETLMYSCKNCPKNINKCIPKYICFASVLLDCRIFLWALPFGSHIHAGTKCHWVLMKLHACSWCDTTLRSNSCKLFSSFNHPFLQKCCV